MTYLVWKRFEEDTGLLGVDREFNLLFQYNLSTLLALEDRLDDTSTLKRSLNGARNLSLFEQWQDRKLLLPKYDLWPS